MKRGVERDDGEVARLKEVRGDREVVLTCKREASQDPSHRSN